MAGDWIKVESVTPDKPEVFRIAEGLSIDPDAVTGKLLRLWIWADQQTVDGNAGSVTKTLVDRLTCVTGFADQLIKVGWMMADDGGWSLPNFDRHNGNTAKLRAQTAKRVANHKKKGNAKGNADSVTSALPREEKRREESIGGKPPITPVAGSSAKAVACEIDVPAELASPQFSAAWSAWLAYRKDRRLTCRPQTLRAQLTSLAPLGSAAASECLAESVRNGWHGVFPGKFQQAKGGSHGNGKPHVGPGQRFKRPETAT